MMTYKSNISNMWFLFLVLLLGFNSADADLKVIIQNLRLLVGKNSTFILHATERPSQDLEVRFDINHPDLIRAEPASIKILKNDTTEDWPITVLGIKPGVSFIRANVTPSNVVDFSQAFVEVTVERSVAIFHVSQIVGWIYFFAWSISFYPQIYINWKRKSVVGLNFDFISLNLVGFLMYSLFNCGLYWITEIEQEYFKRNPKGLNPVKMNDILFGLHALLATIITIVQCFVYERDTQRVSTTARIIHGIFALFVFITGILAGSEIIKWLDFLYYCSYIKLSITLIKYVPQAFYNYKRQSTVGWSIGNIFLDFLGGILSMLQMILDSYNYDDWKSIFGDPTKFGLGLFSVAFDILFIIQHYFLYRDRREGYTVLLGESQETAPEDNVSRISDHT